MWAMYASNACANGDFYFKSELAYDPKNMVVKNQYDPLVDYGCGANNQKCFCKEENEFIVMEGRGTDGTATGLNFTCEYDVYTPGPTDQKICHCVHTVDIPWTKADNKEFLQCDCLEIPNWHPIPESDHEFIVKYETKLKPTPMDVHYCGKGYEEFNGTHCLRREDLVENGHHVEGTCRNSTVYKYVYKDRICRCWKPAFDRKVVDQICPADYHPCTMFYYDCEKPLICYDNRGFITAYQKGSCPDGYEYIGNGYSDYNTGKCIYNCQSLPLYKNSGSRCTVCPKETEKVDCLDKSYATLWEGLCYAKCPEGTLNFESYCIPIKLLALKLHAKNVCQLDTYHMKEKEGSPCLNDCDCNSNRTCNQSKCVL